jgi:hypothetical protein
MSAIVIDFKIRQPRLYRDCSPEEQRCRFRILCEELARIAARVPVLGATNGPPDGNGPGRRIRIRRIRKAA